jgi:hypothetical protein
MFVWNFFWLSFSSLGTFLNDVTYVGGRWQIFESIIQEIIKGVLRGKRRKRVKKVNLSDVIHECLFNYSGESLKHLHTYTKKICSQMPNLEGVVIGFIYWIANWRLSLSGTRLHIPVSSASSVFPQRFIYGLFLSLFLTLFIHHGIFHLETCRVIPEVQCCLPIDMKSVGCHLYSYGLTFVSTSFFCSSFVGYYIQQWFASFFLLTFIANPMKLFAYLDK